MKLSNTFLSPFFCLVFSLLMMAQTSFAQQLMLNDGGSKRTLALVIGVSDYEHLNNLRFAHKDAEDFAQFLTAKEGLNLPKSNVTIFTNDQVTRSSVMINGFDWLNDELNEGDEVFIFFSGHGDIYNKDNIDILKTGFLLTHESEEDKFETTAVSIEDFLKNLHIIAQQKKANIRVILDVCHAGIGLKAGGIINLLEFAGQYDPNKEVIITSCRADESSWEYEALQNGCFSYFFMQGLKGAADKNKDYQITLEELKEYSTTNVNRYVQARDNAFQFPEFKGSSSHRIAFIDGEYQSSVPDEFANSGEAKGGIRKGVDNNVKNTDPQVNGILKKIEREGLSSQEIQAAYELYLKQPEKTPAQRAAKRKMKRDLVAVMTDKADKALTLYFDKEGEIMNSQFSEPVSEYYLKSAKLLGKDHIMYEELHGKYFFMEALRLKAMGQADDPKVLDNLNSSLTIEPNASYTLNELGNVYFAKGELEKALEYYQKANNISPTWGKNIIKTNKALQQQQATQKLFSAKSYAGPMPSPYDMPSDTKLIPKSGDLSATDAGNNQDNVFRIQLAAASKVNRDEFEKLEDLGPVNPEFNPEKVLMITWLGPFETEKEAKMKLKTVRERGFKDAFLVETSRDSSFQKKLDEKISELEKVQAAAMPYQVRIATVTTFNKADFAQLDKIGKLDTEPVTVKGKTLSRVLMRYNLKDEALASLQKVKDAGFKDAYIFENKPQTINTENVKVVPSSYENTGVIPTNYKIRVATVSKLVENQFSNLEDLGKIYMDVVHDKGLIRISLGDYQDKKKATEVLNKVKKLGYKDAFIEF